VSELKSVGLSNQADTAGRVAYHLAFANARKGLESPDSVDACETWWSLICHEGNAAYEAAAQTIFLNAYADEAETFADEHEWAWRRIGAHCLGMD
jgi:hypothetical protein